MSANACNINNNNILRTVLYNLAPEWRKFYFVLCIRTTSLTDLYGPVRARTSGSGFRQYGVESRMMMRDRESGEERKTGESPWQREVDWTHTGVSVSN